MSRPGSGVFRRQTSLLLLVLCFIAAPVMAAAEETESSAVVGDVEPVSVSDESAPHYHPDGSFFTGYRWLPGDDFGGAGEYRSPNSAIEVGIDTMAGPMPHRYHLNIDLLGTKDGYADTGYAYGDLLLFRDIFVGVYHHLDHSDYQDPGNPPAINVNDRNVGDTYYTSLANNFLSLRLKAPAFPFHVFFKHRYLEKEGDIQQRFLIGSFDSITKTSETRRINWHSNGLTLAANSHLGPIELEYAHDFEKFDPGHDRVLYDWYPRSHIYPRPADIYPHNVIPETESSADSLKIHTSYAGGIVASATLSNVNRKNNFSSAESDTWQGAVNLRWITDPRLIFVFKYRHRDQDADNPDTITLQGLNQSSTYTVRQAVSWKKDVFSLSVRYHPVPRLTLIPEYEFEHLVRDNIDEWEALPRSSNIHDLKLTAYGRPTNKLKLKAIYDYTYFENPSYTIDPDASNRINVSATYLPVTWMTAFLDYSLTLKDRDTECYPNSFIQGVADGTRSSRNGRFLGSLSFFFSPKVNLTASYAYERGDIEQDLMYGLKTRPATYFEEGAESTDTMNSYSLSLSYRPIDDLVFMTDLSHTISEGELSPGPDIEKTLIALAPFSRLKVTETTFSIGVTKKILQDWEVGLKFYADQYNDEVDDSRDGTFHVSTFSLKRYF